MYWHVSMMVDGSRSIPDSNDPYVPWQVSEVRKNFGKKYISQLQLFQRKTLLLSLSEEGVHVHSIPGFHLTCLAGRTQLANRFAWDDERSMLCVAIKKRLALLHYDGSEFVMLKDISLPDLVLQLAWLGDSVCVAFKHDYVLVNASTGIFTELFSVGRLGNPCILQLPQGELLLNRDNVGIFIGENGKPSRKQGVTWSDTPIALVYSKPYALASMARYIEVRSLDIESSYGVAQLLPEGKMAVFASSTGNDGSCFVASSTDQGIRQLKPVSFAKQAEALADRLDFRQALTLCSLIPDSQASVRQSLEDRIHARYGYNFFVNNDFDQAMAQFAMCSASSPVLLVRLFPNLVPPYLLENLTIPYDDVPVPEVTELQGETKKKAYSMLLPYLLSHRSRLQAIEQDETKEQPGYVQIDADAPTSSLESEERMRLAVLVDTAILKAMLVMSDTGALLRFCQRPSHVDLQEGEKALKAAGRYSELVALYQHREKHESALGILQKLSQSPDSLPVPATGAAADLKGLPGVWAAVQYIVHCSKLDLSLVRAHSRWILAADPEAGLEMFVQMQPPLSPAEVLPILSGTVPQFRAWYLETALKLGYATADEFHTELVLIYLQDVVESTHGKKESNSRTFDRGSRQPSNVLVQGMNALDRLKELITTSEHIDTTYILKKCPKNSLFDIRALLLERLGQHVEALRIYINKMHSPTLAEAYCDRVYARARATQKTSPSKAAANGTTTESYDIYLKLIEVLLEQQLEGTSKAETWAEVSLVLQRKRRFIDPLHALQLLPSELDLLSALPFLKGALLSISEDRRNASIVKSLRKAANLQVKEEFVRAQQRCVVVTSERACSVCHKRIGGSVLVAYASGQLAHYSCHKRTTGE